MEMFLVTFGVMLLTVVGMAIGVLFGRLPIAGSCGGLNTSDGVCQSCTRTCKSRGKARGNTQQDFQTLHADRKIIRITSTEPESTNAQFNQS